MMDANVNISYTLRLVLDNLKTRQVQLAQDVTAYDHLMYMGHELKDDSTLQATQEHYNELNIVQDKIREEIQHINTQLCTLYGERTADSNENKKQWIINTSFAVKSELERQFDKLRLIQQNFIQSLKSKIFDLERKVDPTGLINLENREKIEIYRNSLNRCESDIYMSGQVKAQLDALMSNDQPSDLTASYEPVDITTTTTTNRNAVLPEVVLANVPSVGVTFEMIKRKQQLILVGIVALMVIMVITMILMS